MKKENDKEIEIKSKLESESKLKSEIKVIYDDDFEIVDTHSHIYSEELSGDLKDVVQRALNNYVKKIVVPATNILNSKEILKKYKEYNNIYVALGIHPEEVAEYISKYRKENLDNNIDIEKIKGIIQKDLDKLEDILKDLPINNNVVAIGEIGLDYYWDKTIENHILQKWLLVEQIKIAQKYNLPVIIHTRESTLDIIEILKNNKLDRKGIMHCTPFNEHLIKETLKIGYYISFSGIVTFKNAKPETSIKLVPDNRLLVETDAPYLTPVPFRGKINEPKNVYYTLEKIAEIRGVSIEYLAKTTTKNAYNIYKFNDK